MPDVWMAPGGKRDFNEGLFECARREIREETNLEIQNLRVIATGCALLKDINMELYFHFVGADYKSGEIPSDPEDGELRWLSLEEILGLDNLLAELKEVLPVILKANAPLVSYKAVYEQGNDMSFFAFEDAR